MTKLEAERWWRAIWDCLLASNDDPEALQFFNHWENVLWNRI